MSEPRTEPGTIDIASLRAWLGERIEPLGRLEDAAPFSGGQSNPTYRLLGSRGMAVLRKQPAGEILPSAHAVDREHRIMTALAQTDVPVPRTYLYCDDRRIVGTPFFIMEYVPGRVFSDGSLPGLEPAERAAVYDSMNEVMARLHMVDWRAAGLEGYGREGGYFARQVKRWTRQLELSRAGPTPVFDEVAAWLAAHLPADDETTICHGDLRLGNLLFHPTEPRAVALLDWELSTLGHPLADVAFNCITWHSTPEEYGGVDGLDIGALGIPDEASYLAAYYARTGRREPVGAFHLAFALFRFAVIFEGIAARARAGNAAAADAARVAHLGHNFVARAARLIG